jgi:hypothetical protein
VLLRAAVHRYPRCFFLSIRRFSFLVKTIAKPKGKQKKIPFDPVLFAATVRSRKPTAKDLKDIQRHAADTIEPKEYDGMDEMVADL